MMKISQKKQVTNCPGTGNHLDTSAEKPSCIPRFRKTAMGKFRSRTSITVTIPVNRPGKKLPFRIEARKTARCAITETEAALTGLLWRKNLSQAAFQSGSQTTPRTGAIRYRRRE